MTFGNNNNEIKIEQSAKDVVKGMLHDKAYGGLYYMARQTATLKVCESQSIPATACNRQTLGSNFDAIENYVNSMDNTLKGQAEAMASGIATSYVDELPEDFNVDTKSTVDYAAGIKALYDVDDKWSIGGGFSWRHRGANSVEKLNLEVNEAAVNKKLDAINPAIRAAGTDAASITQGIADGFLGSMEDGIDEFYLTLLVSRQVIDNLQLTLFGEYTFDSAEEKSQLGTDAKFEVGLRMNLNF